MHPSHWNAADWSAIGTFLSAAVAAVAATAIWGQIRQVKKIRNEESRPYVVVDFEFRGRLAMLAVRNIGRSAAHDVRFTFSPPVPRAKPRKPLVELSMFSDGLPMLAPGRAVRIHLGVASQLFEMTDDEFPKRYSVVASYGSAIAKERYRDPPILLDINQYLGTAIEPEHAEEGAQSLADIARSLQALAGRNSAVALFERGCANLPGSHPEFSTRPEATDEAP